MASVGGMCYRVGMKKQAEEIQYTIRGIKPEVDRALRRKASSRKQSLNQVIVDELTAATGGSRQKADFSDVTGHWVPDGAFDEMLASQRQIDPSKWM